MRFKITISAVTFLCFWKSKDINALKCYSCRGDEEPSCEHDDQLDTSFIQKDCHWCEIYMNKEYFIHRNCQKNAKPSYGHNVYDVRVCKSDYCNTISGTASDPKKNEYCDPELEMKIYTSSDKIECYHGSDGDYEEQGDCKSCVKLEWKTESGDRKVKTHTRKYCSMNDYDQNECIVSENEFASICFCKDDLCNAVANHESAYVGLIFIVCMNLAMIFWQ